MRYLALSALLLSSLVHAYPVTYAFSGSVTDIDLHDRATGNPLTIDPDTPFSFNGLQLLDGNASVTGFYTFDTDVSQYNYACSDVLPVSYQASMEGITFSKAPARGCQDMFHYGADGFSSHIEGTSLTQTGPLNSSIQNFIFNFSNGVFQGGSFSLDYMMGAGLAGQGIRGIIDQVALVSAAVPEPGAWMLVITGLAGVALLRRGRAARER